MRCAACAQLPPSTARLQPALEDSRGCPASDGEAAVGKGQRQHPMTAAATAESSNPRRLPGNLWDLAPHGLPTYAATDSRSEGRATMDRPILIGPDAFHRPAAETPGVDRREAFADDHVWAGRSRTQAGTWSGWHVHPGYDTSVFQTQGRLRLEFGPAASD